MEKASMAKALASGLALAATALQGFGESTRVASDNFRNLGKQASLFRGSKKRLRRAMPRGYTDSAGMPHGTSGDKLRRKAMVGTVSLIGSKRSWLQSWSSTKVARLGLGDRRRKKH